MAPLKETEEKNRLMEESKAQVAKIQEAESGEFWKRFFTIFELLNSAKLIFYVQFEITRVKSRQSFYKKKFEEECQFSLLLSAFWHDLKNIQE